MLWKGTGRLYAPRTKYCMLTKLGLDYLISSEIVIIQNNNRVGFVHQSILDYFMSQRMMENYFDGQTMENISRRKEMQTNAWKKISGTDVSHRIFWNMMSGDFILLGKEMLVSDNIRYYVKYVL